MAKASHREAAEDVIAARRLRFRFMRHDAWENALFVHWPVDPALIAARLPSGLEPDVMDGFAWVGLVLLTERGVSAFHELGRRLVPPIDHYGANIRTYVRRGGVPGIFFWSLECSSVLASLGARFAGIPYFPASMRRTVDIERPVSRPSSKSTPGCASALLGGGKSEVPAPSGSCHAVEGFVFDFSSTRSGLGWERPSVTARWRLKSPDDAGPGGDEDDDGSAQREKFAGRATWFIERYSVYAAWPLGKGPILLRGDVQHPSWPVQSVVIEDLDAESLFAAAGLAGIIDSAKGPGTAAHACFSRGVGPVDFWMLEPV